MFNQSLKPKPFVCLQIGIYSVLMITVVGGQILKAEILFEDVTLQAGIKFKHVLGRSGQKYILETVGSGCAFFDYDNDGNLDIYFVNGSSLPGSAPITAKNALYRNSGDHSFTEVTALAEVGDEKYGVGCCVGDYDNDGFLDIYVTNFGQNILYRNNGDGSFSDVTEAAGAGEKRWSSSAAFLDYDKDGDLDLYVANYLDFRLEDNKSCGYKNLLTYCGPSQYKGISDILYRNNGAGTFTEVTIQAGVSNPEGKGLGVVGGDYDNDGDIDIYVANDDTQNFLYRNSGDGKFSEVSLLAGVGFSENGEAEGSMGVSFGDYDNDGYLDLVVTNYQNQVNTLYHNDGNGLFSDVSYISGFGSISYSYVGWGVGFIDYDNDGWLDLFVANGHLQDNIEEYDKTSSYRQRNRLFKNERDGRFREIASRLPLRDGLSLIASSRGAAFGDYDNDGDIDILISNSDESPNLLKNEVGNKNRWLGIKAVGSRSNRDAIGARIKIVTGNKAQIKEITSGGSYASQSDLRLLFGLETAEQVDVIEVRWPNGSVQAIHNVKPNQYITLVEESEYRQ